MPNHAILGHFRLHRIKTNRNPTRFLSVRVGAYCIRPTDGHVRGRMNLIPIQFLITRIKTNRNPVYFSAHLTIRMVVCGAYAIRPYTGTRKNGDSFIPRIEMNQKSTGFFIPRIKTNQKSAGFSIPWIKMNWKSAGFSNPGPKGMAVPGA